MLQDSWRAWTATVPSDDVRAMNSRRPWKSTWTPSPVRRCGAPIEQEASVRGLDRYRGTFWEPAWDWIAARRAP